MGYTIEPITLAKLSTMSTRRYNMVLCLSFTAGIPLQMFGDYLAIPNMTIP